MIIFLHYTPITGLVPHSLLDHWFNFQLDARIFITESWKACFRIHILLRDSPWSPYHFFFYRTRVEGWVKDMQLWMEYRSRDSMFLTPISSWIIGRNYLVTFVVISQWIPLWLQSSHHTSQFQIATSGPCVCMLYGCILGFYLVSFIHSVCIVGS